MTKKRKIIFASLCAALAVTTCGGALTMGELSADAAVAVSGGLVSVDGEATNQQFMVNGNAETISFGMTTGASIRYSDPMGMRFACSVSAADYTKLTEKYDESNVKFGAIIIPANIIEDREITHATIEEYSLQHLDILAEHGKVVGETFQFNSVIANIVEQNYDRVFYARSYVKVTVGAEDFYAYNEFDAAKNGRSVKSVAMDALVDPQISQTRRDTLKAYVVGLDEDGGNLLSLTYELNDGEGKAQSGFLKEEGLASLATPYRDGYVFDGWYANAEFSGEEVTSIEANSSVTTLYAKWTEKAMAANTLIDFSDSASTSHIKQVYNGYLSKTDPSPVWLSSFEGAEGVVKTQTGNKYTPRYGQSKLSVNMGRTQDEIKALLQDFDYVNVRMYIEGDKETYDIHSQNNKWATVNANEWVDLRITADMMNANGSHYTNYTSTEALKGVNGFANLHNSMGNGNYLFFVHLQGTLPAGYADWAAFNADTEAYNAATEATKGVTVYLDDISVVKFMVADHAPIQKGVAFEIPEITMAGADDATYTATVANASGAVEVTNNSFVPTESGDYTITYTVTQNGSVYTYEYTVNVKRVIPAGFLEDFGEKSSVDNVYVGSEGGSQKVKAGEWLESYTAGGVTKEGVLQVDISTSNNPALWLKFNYTVAELEALNIQSITITLSAKNANNDPWISLSSSASSGDTANSHGHSSKYAGWGTITISIDTLKAYARFAGENSTMDWNSLSVDGDGAWLLRSGIYTVTTLYIDSITYA